MESDFRNVFEIADIVVPNCIEILDWEFRPIDRHFDASKVYHEYLSIRVIRSPDVPFVPHIQCILDGRRDPTFPQKFVLPVFALLPLRDKPRPGFQFVQRWLPTFWPTIRHRQSRGNVLRIASMLFVYSKIPTSLGY